MSAIALDGRSFSLGRIAARKATSIQASAVEVRTQSLTSIAEAIAANGDEVVGLCVGQTRMAAAARDVARSWLWRAAYAAVGICAAVTAAVCAVLIVRAGQGQLGFAVMIIILAALIGALSWNALYGAEGREATGKVGALVKLPSRVLTVGEGRIYFACFDSDDGVTVREIHYDVLGSVRHSAGGIDLYDRAGRYLVGIPDPERAAGTERGPAPLAAYLRSRVPVEPEAA